MPRKSDLIKIMIPAVGGQGGGVLTEWLVQAFFLEGFDVQGISLPGLSQRGGSTVYYLEAFPRSEGNGKQVIFAQFPVPGDVDIIIAQEFLELGRALELGYGSDKTTIVTSTHRIYSTMEKLPIGSGIYSDDNLRKLAANFSSELVELDALKLAGANGMDELAVNAILLGALSASGALPLDKNTYIKSIEQVGVAVKSNLKGFEVGWSHADSNGAGAKKPEHGWQAFLKDKTDSLDEAARKEFLDRVRVIESDFPESLMRVLTEAVYRLSEYQDADYADSYLKEVARVLARDEKMKGAGRKLTESYARNLALLMSYEDGIRVAELKIKSDRFRRIKETMRLRDDQVFKVIDYLKPDAEEIYGLLPNVIVAPALRFTNSSLFRKIWKRKKPLTLGQTPETSSFGGFLRLWILTKFKFMRPHSYRYKKEYALIKRYKEAVQSYAVQDYKLGCLVADSASMVKGYGKVRRRTMDAFYRYLDNVIFPLAEFEKKHRKNFDITLEIGAEALSLIMGETVDGIDKAEKLAREVLEQRAA